MEDSEDYDSHGKSKEIAKQRELEQTQKLQIGIIGKLSDKVEKMSQIKDSKIEENMEEKDLQITNINEKKRFEMSDLSWYKEKLDNSKK